MSSCRCAVVDGTRKGREINRFFIVLAAALLAASFGLIGCASVSVKESRKHWKPDHPPAEIFVEPFNPWSGVFDVNREGIEQEEFRVQTSKMLQEKLLIRVADIAAAHDWTKTPGAKGWLIRGEFIRVNEGSRALRTTVGFGLGATKMETKVKVYDLERSTTKPFLTFRTTGGSNAEPGVLGGLGPPTLLTGASMLSGGLGNAIHGVTEDSWRTAREICTHVRQYIDGIGPAAK